MHINLVIKKRGEKVLQIVYLRNLAREYFYYMKNSIPEFLVWIGLPLGKDLTF